MSVIFFSVLLTHIDLNVSWFAVLVLVVLVVLAVKVVLVILVVLVIVVVVVLSTSGNNSKQ